MDKFGELEKPHFMQPTKAAVIQYLYFFSREALFLYPSY